MELSLRRLALLLGLVLTACTVRAPPEVTLRVVLADDWADTAPVVDAVRTFEAAHPGVRILLQGVPFAQIPDTVRTGIEAGEPADVAQWHAFAAAARGLAEPLDELWVDTLDASEFLPGAVVDVTWQGRRYGVPLDTNAMLLMVNPQLLRAAGVDPAEPPATFAELRRWTEAVTRPDGSVRGTAVASSSWRAYGWIKANGGELVRTDAQGRTVLTLDDPRAVEAIAFVGGLVRDGLAFPPFSRDVSTDAFALFRAETTAVHISGTWDLAGLAGVVDWEPILHPIPGGTTGTTVGTALGGSSLFVPRGAAHRELATAFMVHLIDDTYAGWLVEAEGRLPVRRRVLEMALPDTPAWRVVRAQLEVAHPMLLEAFPVASQAFKEALEDVYVGRASAAEALARAQRAAGAAGETP